MKIVNRKEFLKQPPGTLFSKYEPCIFGELMIKQDSIKDFDFFYQDIASSIESQSSEHFFDKLISSEKDGFDLRMDFNSEGRDGLFEEDQLFAIWSSDDVKDLIIRLIKCI